MRVFHRPEDCRPGDAVDKKAVLDWPLMSNKSAVAFKRWVGLAEVQGKLVRKGNHHLRGG